MKYMAGKIFFMMIVLGGINIFCENKKRMKILMIVPANSVSTRVWHQYIEGKREYHGIKGRPVFLKNGHPTQWPSRNSYIVILWR